MSRWIESTLLNLVIYDSKNTENFNNDKKKTPKNQIRVRFVLTRLSIITTVADQETPENDAFLVNRVAQIRPIGHSDSLKHFPHGQGLE